MSRFQLAPGDATLPPIASPTRTRPYTTAALKNAHVATAYDKWLKAEVQEAIDDTSPSIPHEEVKQLFAAKREALRKRIAVDNA